MASRTKETVQASGRDPGYCAVMKGETTNAVFASWLVESISIRDGKTLVAFHNYHLETSAPIGDVTAAMRQARAALKRYNEGAEIEDSARLTFIKK
jgi:hypothetical protein